MAERYEPIEAPRFVVERWNGAEGIRIKPRGVSFTALFMLAWLMLWTAGGLAAMATVAAHFSFFLALWLCVWALGWLFVASTLAWQLSGSETLRVVGSDLEISQAMLGWTKRSLYRGSEIHNLSAARAPDFFRGYRLSNPFFKLTRMYDFGSVHFTYGARTIYAAEALDEAEGRLIVERLREHLPASASA